MGKLKSSHNKIDNVMYNNEEQKEELGGVLFDKVSECLWINPINPSMDSNADACLLLYVTDVVTMPEVF